MGTSPVRSHLKTEDVNDRGSLGLELPLKRDQLTQKAQGQAWPVAAPSPHPTSSGPLQFEHKMSSTGSVERGGRRLGYQLWGADWVPEGSKEQWIHPLTDS